MARVNMWGVTRKRTQSYRIKTGCSKIFLAHNVTHFFLSIILSIVFLHQGFAYHSETRIIIREREREREDGVCVCVCERERERERERKRERERILRLLRIISFLTLIEWRYANIHV